MTKPITATEQGLEPHWKLRVVLPGALLHLASSTEPEIYPDSGGLESMVADWIDDHAYGDTLGYLDWTQVIAVTWRYSP